MTTTAADAEIQVTNTYTHAWIYIYSKQTSKQMQNLEIRNGFHILITKILYEEKSEYKYYVII